MRHPGAAVCTVLLILAAIPSLRGQAVLDVGSERQLFLDDFWFDSRQEVRLTRHPPQPREVSLACVEPWEGKELHYSSVVRDRGLYRMWYRVAEKEPPFPVWTCYAESRDGITWTRRNLGVYSRKGSTRNNIIGDPKDFTNVSVIVDPNQQPGSSARYKMISRVGGISGFVSRDGIRWQPVRTNPLLPPAKGPFDSHNTLLWDDERRRFVIYLRGVDSSVEGPFKGGRRAIRRTESNDFLHWSEPELVVAADERDPKDLHFYTNAAVKYFRAARAFLMFPMVLYPDRRENEDAPHPGLSDIVFASSRDGIRWDRLFRKPFLSPDLDPENWVDRNPIMGHGVVPTGPGEVSMYYSELLRSERTRIRRCTLRTDGFVSVQGPDSGFGEFTTRPIRFQGRGLELNYATSGGGSLLVELQDQDGEPLEGLSLEDCSPLVGDRIDGIATWRRGEDLSRHAGKTVRLRVRIRDAHLYAFRFVP
ncbi:MAG: hypothetical protein OXH11_06530 [Candidatus Aminicenantes bacterium]|nr:hypothetical protein [Candidatus Aminicenantes bacterium]